MLLKQLTVTLIDQRYPGPDCSKIRMCGHDGAGEFAHYVPEGSSFEEEVKAIKVALLNLIPRIHNFNQGVILVDSKVAIQAVASLQRAIHYRTQTTKTYHTPVDSITHRPDGK